MQSEIINRSYTGRVHAANWFGWLGHLRGQQASGVEIGTYRGDSAEWWLDNILTHAGSLLVCIDTFEGSIEHRIGGVDCTQNEQITRDKLARFGGRAMIRKGRSNYELPDLTASFFDFVYVDAAHDALNVLRDAVFAWDLLKVGGVMVFDDYSWGVMPRPVECPRMAIDAFANCYADTLNALPHTDTTNTTQRAFRKEREL